jgi:alpha,alpha-trehalase
MIDVPGNHALDQAIDLREFDAALFDLDGVVTDTAAGHEGAWRRIFDALLASRPPSAIEDHSPFTSADYLRFVDGRRREDGVENFLSARGIEMPRGRPGDGPDQLTAYGIGERKDRAFRAWLAGGVQAFPGTVTLLKRLRAAGIRCAVFSASRHCAEVLAAAGVSDLFGARVDGVVADTLGLPSKPDPAIMLEAAHRVGARPQRCIVLEDAEAGIQAGRRGEFGLVIGVDRHRHPDRLRRCGADLVVADLGRLAVSSS